MTSLGGSNTLKFDILWKISKKLVIFVIFSRNFAKSLNTGILTKFVILSWKRPFYDIIMEVKTSKFSIFWKNLIKSATFCLIFKKFGKKFEHTYFEILNWKWPFYDVILGVNDLDLWYFVENLIKISYFSFDFPKKFENNNFEFSGWYCLYDIFWKKPVLSYKKKLFG